MAAKIGQSGCLVLLEHLSNFHQITIFVIKNLRTFVPIFLKSFEFLRFWASKTLIFAQKFIHFISLLYTLNSAKVNNTRCTKKVLLHVNIFEHSNWLKLINKTSKQLQKFQISFSYSEPEAVILTN